MGFFTIDDSRLASLTAALGILITAALSLLNRDVVISQQTYANVINSPKANARPAFDQLPIEKN